MAMKEMAPVVPDQDAIGMLTADHKRVKLLFAEFHNLEDEGNAKRKSAIVAQICQELTVHAMLEEEIFYPAVREAIDDADQMDEALVEHAGAKDLIAQLQSAQPDEPLYDAKVTVLSEQVDHHVTEEEGSMFPKARASGVDTIELSKQMERRKTELLGADPLTLAAAPASRGEPKPLPAAARDKSPSRPAAKKAVKSTKKSRK